MPDIDLDFPDVKRDLVIDYVKEKIRNKPCGYNDYLYKFNNQDIDA